MKSLLYKTFYKRVYSNKVIDIQMLEFIILKLIPELQYYSIDYLIDNLQLIRDSKKQKDKDVK